MGRVQTSSTHGRHARRRAVDAGQCQHGCTQHTCVHACVRAWMRVRVGRGAHRGAPGLQRHGRLLQPRHRALPGAHRRSVWRLPGARALRCSARLHARPKSPARPGHSCACHARIYVNTASSIYTQVSWSKHALVVRRHTLPSSPQQNAYTSADETVYQLLVPAPKPRAAAASATAAEEAGAGEDVEGWALLRSSLEVLAQFAFKIRCVCVCAVGGIAIDGRIVHRAAPCRACASIWFPSACRRVTGATGRGVGCLVVVMTAVAPCVVCPCHTGLHLHGACSTSFRSREQVAYA